MTRIAFPRRRPQRRSDPSAAASAAFARGAPRFLKRRRAVCPSAGFR
jgi:hypothetical protein